MKQHVLHQYRFNLGFARQLVEEIPNENMADQPHGMVNHPAWIVGHLAVVADFMAGLAGKPRQVDDAWRKLFNPGSTPIGDRAAYPSKHELLDALVLGHDHAAAAFDSAKRDRLDTPNPVEGFNKVFPTIGDALVYGLTAHESFHLGQLSAWRRSLGYRNLLAQP